MVGLTGLRALRILRITRLVRESDVGGAWYGVVPFIPWPKKTLAFQDPNAPCGSLLLYVPNIRGQGDLLVLQIFVSS